MSCDTSKQDKFSPFRNGIKILKLVLISLVFFVTYLTVNRALAGRIAMRRAGETSEVPASVGMPKRDGEAMKIGDGWQTCQEVSNLRPLLEQTR